MPGYTKEQLEAKGAVLANYVLCSNCSLYWHRCAYEKHLNVPPLESQSPKQREIAIIHPAWDRFLDLLVRTAIKHWMDEQEKIRRREPIETAPAKPRARIEWPPPTPDDPELLTVEEAVVRLGVSREEIHAEFAKNMIPFEFTIPPGPRARRAAAKQAMKAGAPSTARDGGASAQDGSLKKHHAALLERRAKLDEEIRQAERET